VTVNAEKKQSCFIQADEIEVRLRLLTLSDKYNVRKWMSDPYILQLTFVVPGPGNMGATPFTAAAADQYLNVLVSEPTRTTFAIEANGKHVGNIGLKEYNPARGTTEIFIEIGEGEFRGKGVGKGAISILMDYVFFSLGLMEVRLEVLEFNHIAIRTYRSLGFERTHRAGWHYDPQGQYWQVWGMCLTRESWQAKRRTTLFPPQIKTVSLLKI
jgi:RimJ/RimL family protein N-acetyltransferase